MEEKQKSNLEQGLVLAGLIARTFISAAQESEAGVNSVKEMMQNPKIADLFFGSFFEALFNNTESLCSKQDTQKINFEDELALAAMIMKSFISVAKKYDGSANVIKTILQKSNETSKHLKECFEVIFNSVEMRLQVD